MHKNLRFVIPLSLMVLLSIVLLASPTPISASPVDQPKPGVADGSWQWDNPAVTGVTSPIDLISAPKPEWREVMDWEQITLSGAATLCHPFLGGQQGWVGDIRIFTGKSWEPIATTVTWVPDEEGDLMACAKAPSAGTYALFGYFIQPPPKELPKCEFPIIATLVPVDFFGSVATPGRVPANVLVFFPVPDLAPSIGASVSYSIREVEPAISILGNMKGNSYVQDGTIFHFPFPIVVFDEVVYLDLDTFYSAILRITTMGCYIDTPFGFHP